MKSILKDGSRTCVLFAIYFVLGLLIYPSNGYSTISNAPRISYKITKDSSSNFWAINLDVKEKSKQLPMLIIPYSKDSWFSTQDYPEKNIEGLTCDYTTECNIFGSEENEKSISFFNYTIKGIAANLRPDPISFSSFFNISSLSQSIKPTELPPINPPAKVIGGLGLGWDIIPDGTSFLHSFIGLENYIAGIYLSQNEFDITSELMVGDYNPAFAENVQNNYTIAVKNQTRWSISFNLIMDSNGNNYPMGKINETIFDPNLDFIGIPDTVYDGFIKSFIENNDLNCTIDIDKKAFPDCECDEKKIFPTIYFQFGNQNLVFPPKLYIERGVNCTLLFGSTSFRNVNQEFNTFWVFGSPVMTYYYTILNFTDAKFQIILTKAKSLEDKSNWYLTLGIIAIIVCGVGLIACFVIFGNRGKSLKSETLHNQIENENEEKLLLT